MCFLVRLSLSHMVSQSGVVLDAPSPDLYLPIYFKFKNSLFFSILVLEAVEISCSVEFGMAQLL